MTLIDHAKYKKINKLIIIIIIIIMSLKYCQVTLQTTIKSQKDFKRKRHKYMENNCIVSFFLMFVIISNVIYIFINCFFTTYVDNNFFNIVYDQICFQWIFKI